MKILLAVDGSDYTKRMLAYLATHGEMLANVDTYTALTVVPAVPANARSFLDPAVVDEYYRTEAERVLEPVRRFAAQKGWKLETERRVGNAGDVIAEMAGTGRYDLLVMGSHGHSAVAGALLGSVTSRVLARSSVPLLILH